MEEYNEYNNFDDFGGEPLPESMPDPNETPNNGKVLFFAILFGVFLIVMALLGNRLLRTRSVNSTIPDDLCGTVPKNEYVDTSNPYVDTDVNVYSDIDINQNDNTSTPIQDMTTSTDEPINIGKDVNHTEVEMVPNVETPTWLPFSVKYYGEQTEFVESIYTVSDIQGYAKKSGNSGVLRHIILGSINGLDGTFELEVSYDIANKLTVGTSFKVWYSTINVGGIDFISEIKTQQN